MSDKNTFQTVEKKYTVDGVKYKIIAEYGFRHIQGNSEPYFSITGSTYYQDKNNKWMDDSGGCIHEKIVEHFPNLKPLIQFHLWGQNTQLPIYYIENGIYHYKHNIEVFKEHIILQPDEVIPDTDIKEWLMSRIPMLNKLFQKTITKFIIDKITM